MKKWTITVILIILISGITSCKKYLETKSVQSLSTPGTLDDLEAILNASLINMGTVLLNGSTDEYYYIFDDWNSRADIPKYGYVWDAQLNNDNDWKTQYVAVFYANNVLFNLNTIEKGSDATRWDNIKGAALFYRALAFYKIALLYAPQYDAGNSSEPLGIPLRLNADINEASARSTVSQTYDQIIKDLEEAYALLPGDLPTTVHSKTRPTKAAALGFLARVYLQMGNYSKAKENAEACLSQYNILLDFNDPQKVNAGNANPIKQLNEEVIFYINNDASPASNVRAKIEPSLYNSFEATDVRKTAFFTRNTDGSYRFKGSYNSGSVNLFCGMATDEMYLIKAECAAREGRTQDAMQTLNDLLRKRYLPSFINKVANSPEQALALIIAERKKELIFRDIRWADLKRLNKEQAFAVTLKRDLSGQIYTLPPNDPRYALLIPIEVLNTVNLPQNPR